MAIDARRAKRKTTTLPGVTAPEGRTDDREMTGEHAVADDDEDDA